MEGSDILSDVMSSCMTALTNAKPPRKCDCRIVWVGGYTQRVRYVQHVWILIISLNCYLYLSNEGLYLFGGNLPVGSTYLWKATRAHRRTNYLCTLLFSLMLC